MLVGAFVLLPNGTFIWPVTFSCKMLYYRRILSEGNTDDFASAAHSLCDFLCKVLLHWPHDFLFVSQYTQLSQTFPP